MSLSLEAINRLGLRRAFALVNAFEQVLNVHAEARAIVLQTASKEEKQALAPSLAACDEVDALLRSEQEQWRSAIRNQYPHADLDVLALDLELEEAED